MTEKAAKEAGINIKVGKFPFMASGKATAAGATEGFVKVIKGITQSEEFDKRFPQYLKRGSYNNIDNTNLSILEHNSSTRTEKIKERITITQPNINLHAEFSGIELKNINVVLKSVNSSTVYDFKSNTLHTGDNKIKPGTYDFYIEAYSEQSWKWYAALKYK